MRLLSVAFIAALAVPALAAVPHDPGDMIVHGDYLAAEPLVRSQIAKQPGDPFAHYNLAVILKNTGRFDEAVAEYHRAFDIFQDTHAPENDLAKCLYGIALTQELKGDPRVAVGAWDNYLRFASKHPQEPRADVDIARMHLDGEMRAANMRGPYPFGPPTAGRKATTR